MGSTSLTLAAPVDWRVGERLVLSALAGEKPMFIFNMHPIRHTKGTFEIVKITSVSGDKRTVSLEAPTRYFHSGGWVRQGGTVMDTRDTAALIERNVELKGGDDPLYDTVSGVKVRDQGYGLTVHVLGRTYEPTPGDPTTTRSLPPGSVQVEHAALIDVGKQFLYSCGPSYPPQSGYHNIADH